MKGLIIKEKHNKDLSEDEIYLNVFRILFNLAKENIQYTYKNEGDEDIFTIFLNPNGILINLINK